MIKINRQTFLVILVIFWLLILFTNTYFPNIGYAQYTIIFLFSIVMFFRHKDTGLSSLKSLLIIYLPLIISGLYILAFNKRYVNENWLSIVLIGELLIGISLLAAFILCFRSSSKIQNKSTTI
jgi:hypothetical protein